MLTISVFKISRVIKMLYYYEITLINFLTDSLFSILVTLPIKYLQINKNTSVRLFNSNFNNCVDYKMN